MIPGMIRTGTAPHRRDLRTRHPTALVDHRGLRRYWCPARCYLALRIPSDNALGTDGRRLEPGVVATREFQQVFSERPWRCCSSSRPDPLSRTTRAAACAALETALDRVPGVVDVLGPDRLERMRPGRRVSAGGAAGEGTNCAAFVSGTALLPGPGARPATAQPRPRARGRATRAERDAALAAIDRGDRRRAGRPGPGGLTGVRRVGAPVARVVARKRNGRGQPPTTSRCSAPFVLLLTVSLYRSCAGAGRHRRCRWASPCCWASRSAALLASASRSSRRSCR